jgi:Sigma-70, region 4
VRVLSVFASSLALHTEGMAIDEEAAMFVTGTIGFFGTELDAPPAMGGSFAEVVLPHLDAAYRLARWLMRNEHDAEDVVQEASLRELEGLSYRELADVMSIPIGTVMSSLSRARQAFREALDNELKQYGISARTHPREQEVDAVRV